MGMIRWLKKVFVGREYPLYRIEYGYRAIDDGIEQIPDPPKNWKSNAYKEPK